MAGPAKASMLPGYNHNVNYRGITFHIQTEDSGVSNPHIITLLYSGGNILARKKTSYADIIKHERLTDVVRELMQDQHKHMLKDLKNGAFDGHPLVKGELEKRGIKPKAAAKPVAAAAPTPPLVETEIKEKPAQRTIELRDDRELSDSDIFGADIISNKSLDEVILTFLAQRLEEEEK
jgi:hypothetical protein